MTVDRKRPNQSLRPPWDERTREFRLEEAAENQSSARYVVAFLVLFAVVALCAVSFLVVRLWLRNSAPAILPKFETWTPSATAGTSEASATPILATPVPGVALVSVSPQQGYINTLITVSGQGWWPGEPVFVFLRSKDEGDSRGYSYAAAVADDDGNMHTALTFPNEMRWIGQEWADVIARGSRSGLEATSRFMLLVPTATATLPPPTPRPTLPPTNTPLPTDTPLPTSTPTPELVITDWRGEYYANMVVAGDPVLVRNDTYIAFNWADNSPGPQVPADGFSARWTRRLDFHEGPYRFVAAADDGVRLWIDGQLLIDEWHDGPLTSYYADIYLGEGTHALQLEYYENLGGAAVEFTWSRIEQPTATPTISPTPTATPTASPTATPTISPTPVPSLPETWHGEYYANADLSGDPVMVREDADVNFEWGANSPDESIPAEMFSARWTRDFWTLEADYQFELAADDGVRFWVDDELLVDEWHVSTGDTYRVTKHLREGVHSLRIEYNEIFLDARIHYKSTVLSR